MLPYFITALGGVLIGNSISHGSIFAKGGVVNLQEIISIKEINLEDEDYKIVRRKQSKKFDKIELYSKYKNQNTFYGTLLYKNVPIYTPTFKSKMINDRNQLFAFSGTNRDIADAVLKGEKPFGSLVEVYSSEEEKAKSDSFFNDVINECIDKNLEYYLGKEDKKWSRGVSRRVLQICHKGTFGKLFDLDALINDYEVAYEDGWEQDITIRSISNRKLSYYLKNDWDDMVVITGLILGIPPYYTMSLLISGYSFDLNKIWKQT